MASPLSVSVHVNGKKRLILDLRIVNFHVWKQSVKYEDLKTARTYLDKEKYLFSFDLKSGYHHVEIHQEHTEYLGFSWNSQYFKFTVLPFGLTSAPYIFSKLMRYLAKKWRSESKVIVVYLDGGLGIADNLEDAHKHANEIHDDLCKAGFIINIEKSQWEPKLYCQWLGFKLDTNKGTIFRLPIKIQRILDTTNELKNSKNVYVKSVASLVGQIIAMTPALGNVTRLMTRSVLNDIQSATSWQNIVIRKSNRIVILEKYKLSKASHNDI